MTDPLIELETRQLQVSPGGQVSVRVTVRNMSHIVEGFRIEVLPDEVANWADAMPAELRVDVGQEASSVVVFTPGGAATAPGGSIPFAVRARSLVDSSTMAVAEGEIEVGQVLGLTSKLTPVTSSGRWRGRHRVAFTNWGNGPVHLRLTAQDPDEKLGFLLAPDSLDVGLGATAEARLKVRTRRPFLRGSPERHPFQVVAEPYAIGGTATPVGRAAPDPQRQVLDGAMQQKPIISRGVALVGLVAVITLVAGVAAAVRGGGGSTPDSRPQGPPAPTGLVIAGAEGDTVGLVWAPGASAVDSYVVQYHEVGSKVVTEAPPVPGTQHSAPVAGLDPTKTYCFAVYAVANGANSNPSPESCQKKPSSKPVVPPTVQAQAEGATIKITWQVPQADSVTVIQNQGGATSTLPPVAAPGNFVVASDLVAGENYCYSAVAAVGDVTSKPSAESCVTAPAGASSGGGSGTTTTGTTGVTSPPPATLTPGQVIVVVSAPEASVTDPNQVMAQMSAYQQPVGFFESSTNPDFFTTPPSLDKYYFYLGPYPSETEATAACQAVAQQFHPPGLSCNGDFVETVGSLK